MVRESRYIGTCTPPGSACPIPQGGSLLFFPCSGGPSSDSNHQLHHSDSGLLWRREHEQKDGSDKGLCTEIRQYYWNKNPNSQNSVFHPLKRVIWTLQSLRNLSRTQGGAGLLGASQKPNTMLTLFSKRTMPGLMEILDFVTPEQPDLIHAGQAVAFHCYKGTGLGSWTAELKWQLIFKWAVFELHS